jgi:hypothetical protein
MREYSILHPLVLSFFSPRLYRDVGRNWKGMGFLYLLAVLTLCWTVSLWGLHRKMSAGLSAWAPKLVEQVPAIMIKDGRLSIDAPEPYVIASPDDGTPLVVIDTTGRTASLEKSRARVLVTGGQVIVRKSEGETRTYDLSQVKELRIDKERVAAWVEAIRNWMAIVIFPFALAGSYVFRILQALVYGAIGLLFDRMFGTRLDYPALVRLAAVAVTPALILRTVSGLAGVSVPFAGLLGFAVAMAYLAFAVKANADQRSEDATRPVQPA